MKVHYLSSETDINTLMVGEIPAGFLTRQQLLATEKLPVVAVPDGDVLAIGYGASNLVVLLGLGSSLSVAPEVAPLLRDVTVFGPALVRRGAEQLLPTGAELDAQLAAPLRLAKASPEAPAKTPSRAKKAPAKKAKAKPKKAAKKAPPAPRARVPKPSSAKRRKGREFREIAGAGGGYDAAQLAPSPAASSAAFAPEAAAPDINKDAPTP